MKDINTNTIGLFCNTLNAKEGQYRHLKNRTQQDEDMELILRLTQEKIWSLWWALKESGNIKTCDGCGFEYYDIHNILCPICARSNSPE